MERAEGERPTSNAQAQAPRPEGAGTALSNSGQSPTSDRAGAAAPASAGNSSEHTPDDIRWMEGRDPDRNWAITRAQPVASLAVAGKLWGFSRSVAPPAPLIGKRLILTAGGSHVPFKDAGPTGWAAVADYCGQEISVAEIPSGRERLYREAVKTLPPSQSVGAVRLVAAFQIGRVLDDGSVYADLRPGTAYSGPRGLGIWKEFDGRALPIVEKLERGRWIWCFDAHHEFDLDKRVAIKGFGGIWDYVLGVAHRGALPRHEQGEGAGAPGPRGPASAPSNEGDF